MGEQLSVRLRLLLLLLLLSGLPIHLHGRSAADGTAQDSAAAMQWLESQSRGLEARDREQRHRRHVR